MVLLINFKAPEFNPDDPEGGIRMNTNFRGMLLRMLSIFSHIFSQRSGREHVREIEIGSGIINRFRSKLFGLFSRSPARSGERASEEANLDDGGSIRMFNPARRA